MYASIPQNSVGFPLTYVILYERRMLILVYLSLTLLTPQRLKGYTRPYPNYQNRNIGHCCNHSTCCN